MKSSGGGGGRGEGGDIIIVSHINHLFSSGTHFVDMSLKFVTYTGT